MTLSIIQFCFTPQRKLNYHAWFDKVRYMTKTRQDNDMTDSTGVVYIDIEIDLSWLIEQDAVYHENKTELWLDQS